jgi:tRNA nucleotidyltransferase/poly(A) polymerase
MKQIVDSGEIEELSKERLWGELSKAFNTNSPWMFFEV